MTDLLPVVEGYTDVRHVIGGHSHEVFYARSIERGDDVVLRVYGARHRGPEAPGVHASVLRLVRGVVPAPELVEVREPVPGRHGGLVVTTAVPGQVLADVLHGCDNDLTGSLARSLGEALGRMSGIAMSGPGDFLDHTLGRRIWEPGAESLVTWLDMWVHREPLARLGADLARLRTACEEADSLLAVAPRACLVHGDLSPRNVMCDPATGEITGIIDWEFAHSGHPMEDAGHQMREHPGSLFTTTMLETMGPWLPRNEQADVEVLRRRARAADLYWIIEIASRLGEPATATVRCHRILTRIAATGDLLADLG
jgi:aminoglycoside phosphotransferase (APT) family kinase protein